MNCLQIRAVFRIALFLDRNTLSILGKRYPSIDLNLPKPDPSCDWFGKAVGSAVFSDGVDCDTRELPEPGGLPAPLRRILCSSLVHLLEVSNAVVVTYTRSISCWKPSVSSAN